MAGKDIAIEYQLLLASCEKEITPKTTHWQHREWNTKVVDSVRAQTSSFSLLDITQTSELARRLARR